MTASVKSAHAPAAQLPPQLFSRVVCFALLVVSQCTHALIIHFDNIIDNDAICIHTFIVPMAS